MGSTPNHRHRKGRQSHWATTHYRKLSGTADEGEVVQRSRRGPLNKASLACTVLRSCCGLSGKPTRS
eukprot:544010-Prorocentrum_lima.AAC.1